jgi:hypothetical protein
MRLSDKLLVCRRRNDKLKLIGQQTDHDQDMSSLLISLFSLRNLCDFCAAVVNGPEMRYRRDAEHAKEAQRISN